MKRTITAAIFVLVAITSMSAMPTHAEDAAQTCRNLYRMTDSAYAVEPGIWITAKDAAPAHCRVRGVINRAIRFEITLPGSGWNTRMMFSTVGGFAGNFGDTTSLLSRGFAMASSDTGHEGPESTFLRQPQAVIDYAYRGNHLVTVFAKRVIGRFYGRDVQHAYLQGCSNGGRAALMEALRFPDDYDGIIAGAPAFQLKESWLWHVAAHRAQVANPLTHEALEVLAGASEAACDTIDGVEDGVIGDPRACTSKYFDLSSLMCFAGEATDCLSEGQIRTAKFLYGGLVDLNTGAVLAHGVMPGVENGGDWGSWGVGGTSDVASPQGPVVPHEGRMITILGDLLYRDPSFDPNTFDPIRDRDKLNDAAAVMDVNSAELREFQDRGGKLLMYQGWNDYPLRPQRALDYLSLAEAQNGGAENTSEFFRLFMVPGMQHCAGGPGPWQADYVDPIVDWVENGKAPERIIGKQPGIVAMKDIFAGIEPAKDAKVFTRPLCPHPQSAKYSGRGNVDDASSWDCAAN